MLGLQWIGVGQMTFFGFTFGNSPKGAEAMRTAVQNARAAAAHRDRNLIMAEVAGVLDVVDGMGEPLHRSTDEARAYNFALDLIRRRGPSEASRIADLVVRNVQMLSREPK